MFVHYSSPWLSVSEYNGLYWVRRTMSLTELGIKEQEEKTEQQSLDSSKYGGQPRGPVKEILEPVSSLSPYSVGFHQGFQVSWLAQRHRNNKRIYFWLSISACQGDKDNVLSSVTIFSAIKAQEGCKCWSSAGQWSVFQHLIGCAYLESIWPVTGGPKSYDFFDPLMLAWIFSLKKEI